MDDLVERIYRAMGVDSSILDQGVVEGFLFDWLGVFPDNECLALHNTVISCYEYLIKYTSGNASSSGSGKRREKNGKREVEVEGFNDSSGWEDALNNYLSAPWSSFPLCKDELSTGIAGGRVIVGGVREDKIEDINDNENIRTGGASEVCGVKQQNPYNKFGGRYRSSSWYLRRRC